jgi:predicted nucleic acid-binding protein
MASKSRLDARRIAAAFAAFLPYVEALALDEDAALHYAEIRADLKRRGAMIGANDLFSRRTPVHSG